MGTSRLPFKSPLFPPLGLGINSLCSVLYHVLQLRSSCTLVLGWEVNRKGGGSCKLKAGGCELRCLVSKIFLVLHFTTFISFFPKSHLFWISFFFPLERNSLKIINGRKMSSFFNLSVLSQWVHVHSHALSEGGIGCPVPSLSSSDFFKVQSLSNSSYTSHFLNSWFEAWRF